MSALFHVLISDDRLIEFTNFVAPIGKLVPDVADPRIECQMVTHRKARAILDGLPDCDDGFRRFNVEVASEKDAAIFKMFWSDYCFELPTEDEVQAEIDQRQAYMEEMLAGEPEPTRWERFKDMLPMFTLFGAAIMAGLAAGVGVIMTGIGFGLVGAKIIPISLATCGVVTVAQCLIPRLFKKKAVDQ